ncbi:MAG: CHASE2 domain-containing protein [Candidatus Rokubacteria bacterium]|nr:CHASE2 domain-containing protein [Candidatus Rokubacteria bacterium]
MTAVRTLIMGIAAGLLTAALVFAGALEMGELGLLNWLFELRGARPPAFPIVIVTIDEDSFDELDLPWPFPRALHANLVETINAGRPITIGFDVLFSEPSPRGRADDETLGGSVARAGNIVLASAITEVSESFYTKVDLNPPLPVIRRGAAAIGTVSVTVDADGTLRRVPLQRRHSEELIPSFDLALYRLARAAGLPAAELPPPGEFLINYRGGPKTFPWIPYHRVVQGEVPPETFQGKIVLVGPTSAILQDVYSTPFARARTMPGVEIHANALETLLGGLAVREAPRWLSTAVALAAAIAGAWLVVRLRALRALAASAGLWAALAAVTFLAFSVWGAWFRFAAVTLALLLGYGAAVVGNFVREQRERRRLGQFFSPAVLTEIVRQRGDVSLGSSRRLVTVLFSDIRGFTALAERVAPEQVVEMLREYLSEMTEVVFEYGGTVDKYIGDCVMALYNAPIDDPDHAANAVRTGLKLQERTLEVSARWEAKLGVTIRNGVGINTGEAIVGTMGSRQRLEYTAIGDVVNIAAHLEALTKEYGASIIISESTHERVRGQFPTYELGAVAVKGRAETVRIWGVLPANLRKHPRVALGAAATVTVVGAREVVPVRTRDIAKNGISLTGVPAELGVGTRLRIQCEGGALPTPIEVEGTVVWRSGDAAGVSFASGDGVPALPEPAERPPR